MKHASFASLATLLFFVVPKETFAQLVPCGGGPGDPCDTCDFGLLITNVLDWLTSIGGIVYVIILVVAGLFLVTSTGNVSLKNTARRLIINATVGYMIILAGWFIVGFVVRIILPGNLTTGTMPWDIITCYEAVPLEDS